LTPIHPPLVAFSGPSEMYLRCAISSTPRQWVEWLSLAELWYNSSYHSSLKCSPFKALYGVEPSFRAVSLPLSIDNESVTEMLGERHHFSELLREQLSRAQNRMKQDAEKDRTPRQFQVGEMILLRLQPYAQSSVVNRPCPKLVLKYFGPYPLVARIGTIAYK
jgi:hypothetical protein